MTDVNDIVLIYLEEKPQVFARVEAIEPDSKRGWFHIKLLLLQTPLQIVTWILRDTYINGETFTMDGKPIHLERVVSPEKVTAPQPSPPVAPGEPPATKGNVISLTDLKKRS
jgi:hypothetical protein